jgi:hypothetical protein
LPPAAVSFSVEFLSVEAMLVRTVPFMLRIAQDQADLAEIVAWLQRMAGPKDEEDEG